MFGLVFIKVLSVCILSVPPSPLLSSCIPSWALISASYSSSFCFASDGHESKGIHMLSSLSDCSQQRHCNTSLSPHSLQLRTIFLCTISYLNFLFCEFVLHGPCPFFWLSICLSVYIFVCLSSSSSSIMYVYACMYVFLLSVTLTE